MKVVFVVDSITGIKEKIELLKTNFGSDICFVVRSHFTTIFKSFGYDVNAVYSHNLANTIHALLLKSNVDNVVICHASVKLDSQLMNRFTTTIGTGEKVVNVMPNYNSFERMSNGAYNLYVRSIFKNNDCMASPKLQYLPALFVTELMTSHFANRLFELNPQYVKTIYIEEKDLSTSLKVKSKFNKFQLLPIIAALLITAGLLLTIAFTKVSFISIFIFVVLYILDLFISLLYQYKLHFDDRFFK